MKDSLPLKAVKILVRSLWILEYALRRTVKRRSYQLAGSCGGCAKCCERPTIRGGFFTFRLPTLRRTFLWWQLKVNGFALVEADEEAGHFVFRCSHLDWETRRCDSYGSRPFLCRDYPRALMDQPWPELFTECGFRPRARNATQMLADLEQREIPDEKRKELEKRLYLR